MIDNEQGRYRAYDGTNNAFYALADNSAAQAIFRIDDDAFEKKLIAYKRAAYEEGSISIETRKIFENCNIVTVFYFEEGEKEQSREKYCWQYDIGSENARFFASLMGAESILYKKGNKITLYEAQKPKSTIELFPESTAFESYGIPTVFELLFRLLGNGKPVASISVPKAIFLQRVQYKYLRGAGMRVPRKSYTELMESPPVTYIDNTSAEGPRQNPIDDMPPERTAEKTGEENRHRAEDKPFPEDTERHSRTKKRCRRLMKKSGILILCTEEKARRMHDFFDTQPKKSALEYKNLLFRFLDKEGRSGQKTYSGFYVPLDAAQDDRKHIQALSQSARNAGIETLIHITHGHNFYKEEEEKAAELIGTEDGKSVFTLQTADGYELLSQLIPFLQSETKGKRLWAMQYED